MIGGKSLVKNIWLPQVEVDVAALSHPGRVRSNNEDHYIVATFERTMKSLLTSLPEGDIPGHHADTGYALMVADGMGGAAAGEIASRTAITSLIDLALRTPDWIMRLNKELADEILQRMSERLKEVDAALVEKARLDPSLSGMGTTVTIACSVGANLLIAHVGDSRVHLFRKGQLYQLTNDHTFAQALASAGAINPEDVESHPMRHMLTQVVGSAGGHASADLRVLQLTDGDQILLSTDGLTDMVHEEAIAQALAVERPVSEGCRALVDLALAAGGLDNVTVVLAQYRLLS